MAKASKGHPHKAKNRDGRTVYVDRLGQEPPAKRKQTVTLFKRKA